MTASRKLLAASGAAATAFSPDDIAGLSLWLDASDATTITESAGAVSVWADKSTNGNDAGQATSGKQPDIAGPQNGLDTIGFNGTSDYFTLPTDVQVISSNCTILAVVKIRASQYGGILTHFNGDGRSRMIINNNSTLGWQVPGTINSGAVTAFKVVAADKNDTGNIANLWLNQVSQGTTTNVTGTNAGTNWIGTYRAAEANYGDFELGELIVYDSVLSTGDRGDVETYLADKWGITL